MHTGKCTIGALCGLLASVAVAHPLAAQVVTYTNAGAFTAAAGPSTWVVDFETFTTDVDYGTSALHVGPLSIEAFNVGRNTEFIDAVPFIDPQAPQFGHALMEAYVDNEGPWIDFVFDAPLRGFFADFLYAGNTAHLNLNLLFTDGTNASIFVPGPGTGLQSFGFTSVTGVTRIRLSNTLNDGFYVDNILGVTADAAVVTTPEPATLAFTALGLVGLFGFRRRSRNS